MGSFAQTFKETAPCMLARDYKDPPSLVFERGGRIADGIADRLTLSPDVANGLVERMRAVTDHTTLGGSTLVPQLAGAGAGGGTSYVTSLTQNITTPKPLSASEMTREGQDLLRRSRWQLP